MVCGKNSYTTSGPKYIYYLLIKMYNCRLMRRIRIQDKIILY